MKHSIFKFSGIRRRARFIATFFALNLLFEIVAPLKLWALTGGPSQPEVNSFEPIGTTEMVDLFTGDFTYNIPLFDVGGYPVNISYHAGVSMDQEASWVGLGWNINPGAITRGMRGLPDDFMAEDVKKEMKIKTQQTLALNLNTDLEIFGFIGRDKRNKKAVFNERNSYEQQKTMTKLSKTKLAFGIVFNNYKGIGYSLDLNTEISKTSYMSRQRFFNDALASNYQLEKAQEKGDKQTAKQLDKHLNSNVINRGTKGLKGNIGINASSQDGAKIEANLAYDYKFWDKQAERCSISPSIGLGYNSFLGVTSFDAGFAATREVENTKNKDRDKRFMHNQSRDGGTYLPIGNYSYVPNIMAETRSTSNSFNATVGGELMGGHPSLRFSGFYNTEEVAEAGTWMEAYGYLYEQESYWNRGNKAIMMDFNREKESSGNKNATHLPMANHTYDIYSVSGQGTGGMYRPHRKTIGLLHDRLAENRNKQNAMNDLGIELGFGANFHLGINYKNKVQRSSTGLWKNGEDNLLISYMNYRMVPNDINNPENKRYKQTYFKAAGEQTPSDNDISEAWGGKDEVSLRISKTDATDRNLRFGMVQSTLNQKPWLSPKSYTEDNAIRSNVITYLTAEESSRRGVGMDAQIIAYPQDYWSNYVKNQIAANLTYIHRYGEDNGAQKHHISEIISNSGDGMRYVYGLPAYNVTQKEVTFAVSKDYVSHPDQGLRNHYPEKGLVEYSPGEGDNSLSNARGEDNLYMSTTLPAYAHSYLLTGVLSPDYADLTGDGITDDDYGSAVKFNYYRTPGHYQWRTPYEQNRANLDEGFISNSSDNKGSYVYGEKEIWYLQSMESKTHVAEFKLSPRHDGHGVVGQDGGLSPATNNELMKLDSIVIYSKIDLMANGVNAVPVKTIVFQYDYSLCAGVPNNDNGGGKLTLKNIYFTYQNSGKGVLNPYKFTYADFNPGYSHVHYDRWGNYKYADENLPNRYYPYLDYDTKRDTLDKYATAWNLTQIELPSGGKINVEYEADDYAYVQDRKAMQMVKIVGAANSLEAKYYEFNFEEIQRQIRIGRPNLIKDNLYDAGKNNNYLFFKLREDPGDIPSASADYLRDHYLRNQNGDAYDYIYYRFKVNMDPRSGGKDNFEYVSGYAQIDLDKCGITSDKKFGYIKLKDVNQGDVGITKCNPICKQAWQMGLQYLRKVMYPGSDQSQVGEDGDRTKPIKALINAYGQALNIFTGPYENLRMKQIAKNFEVNKSYIRLHNPDGFKVGGGCRVKKITINDNWHDMDTEQESGQYGQEFSYITKTDLQNNKGEVISSGVASYEPFIGGDENAFREPAFYHTNKFMFPDLNDYIEEPFGESFFPSPVVGYSRVVVRNIPKPGAVVTSTGKVVHEFYTAKDFPVRTTNTPLRFLQNGGGTSSDNDRPGNKRGKKFTKALVSMFNVVKRDYMVASQGYSIILNDMHGKPKSTAIYSSLDESDNETEKQFTGRLISGTEYKYKTEASTNPSSFNKVFDMQDTSRFKPVPKEARLFNTVWVMKENGNLEQQEIATSYDVAVDTRESKSHFRHAGLDFNAEQFAVWVIPCPQPKYIVNQSLFQSAVVTKVVQQYGVLEETVAYDHSSIVHTKNLVWDEQTGQVLLTATTNEFEDPIYNFTYPAHLAFDRMGPAYKNIDYETDIIISNGKGDVNIGFFTDINNYKFVEGDELIMSKDATDICQRGWVLKTEMNPNTGEYQRIRIIDITGQPIVNGLWHIRIIRSGRRNLSAVPVGAVTTMNRNIFDINSSDRLNLETDIVQSSAAVFDDQWQGYIDRAAKLREHCDTLKLGMQEIYELIKSMVETGHPEKYVFNGDSLPPLPSTLSAYPGMIEQAVTTHAQNVLNTEAPCGNTNQTLGNIYFGRTVGNLNAYFFRAKYQCPAEDTSRTLLLTCEIGITHIDTCHLELDSADAISDLTIINDSSGIAQFTIYDGTDSCTLQLSFPNTCFFNINCYPVMDCDYYAGDVINPFVNNLRGVWRQKEAFAFHSSRNYKKTTNQKENIRRDGFITDYKPFWKFKGGDSSNLRRNTSATGWVSTGQATIYAPEGNGLEEADALGIYSSQLFGYNNLLVTAQAGNARHCQIAFDGFEDYLSPIYNCDKPGHFDFREGLIIGYEPKTLYDNFNVIISGLIPVRVPYNANAHIARDTAHTGLYSLCIKASGSHSVSRPLDYSGITFNGTGADDSFFRVKSLDRLITPFAPTAGKYVVSAWLYEDRTDPNSVNNYTQSYVNVKVYNGGSAVVDCNIHASGMIIDKWQRIDSIFSIPSGADSIRLTLVNNSSGKAYFDDIRIHPFDAKMASHVYDYVLMKVMAELDDNNYATFYEYDSEGSLVRVKRETERGIMTIQESRKSIRKHTP